MPFECEFAFRPAVAQLTASGAPELEEWRVAIVALVRDPSVPLDAPLLCDLRSLRRLPRSRAGGTAIEELLQLMPERRVAFVARAKTASLMAAQLSTTDRSGFEVFTDYRRALHWLVFAPDQHRSPSAEVPRRSEERETTSNAASRRSTPRTHL